VPRLELRREDFLSVFAETPELTIKLGKVEQREAGMKMPEIKQVNKR